MILFFYNLFVNQYRFEYSKPSGNKDDVDNDNGVGDETIPLVPEFGDASRSSFVVLYNWVLSHRCMLGGSDLGVGQIFSSKNELVNVIK
jgi:hypothetical protein